MSRFLISKYSELEAYVPGEQPQDKKYIKLNTNESPFPPTQRVIEAVGRQCDKLQLYSDPECTQLCYKMAEYLKIRPSQLLLTNGSDEILNFIFAAYGDVDKGFAFPDISYGFYEVFADYYGLSKNKIPLNNDFTININDYLKKEMNIVIANPNAPTGIALRVSEIEQILTSNKENVVVIDEAYVDFGAESCIKLIDKYDNLIVTRTFSKSFSLAGARLGVGIANEKLIEDLKLIKYSTNPYNVNSMTLAAGMAALEDSSYYMNNCSTIIKNREYTKKCLEKKGFNVCASNTNFLFVSHPSYDGFELYKNLKSNGILVRHFNNPRISNYNRITIGKIEDMKVLITVIDNILKGN